MHRQQLVSICAAILMILGLCGGCGFRSDGPPSFFVPPQSTTTTSAATTSTTDTAISTTTSRITNATKTSTNKRSNLTGSHKIDVPVLAQKPEYPSGCESVSAVMALQYFGEPVRVYQFIDAHLPMNSRFHYKGGMRYGPSPYEYFIGHPTSEQSYGCMAPVIEKALVSYFGDDSRVINATGASLPELCARYIDNDLPVLVWVTIAMLETYTNAEWYLEDGSLFEWPANEHCMVLVGYDKNNYIFNDPYSGKIVKHRKALSEDRYAALGQQSIVITR